MREGDLVAHTGHDVGVGVEGNRYGGGASSAESGCISFDEGVGALTESAGLRGMRDHLTGWASALWMTWWIFWTVEPERPESTQRCASLAGGAREAPDLAV